MTSAFHACRTHWKNHERTLYPLRRADLLRWLRAELEVSATGKSRGFPNLCGLPGQIGGRTAAFEVDAEPARPRSLRSE